MASEPGPDRREKTREEQERAALRVESSAELGRVLRRRRRHLGHTQAEAAALCGVGVRFLSELERGKRTAELGLALRVARRLGLQIFISAREGKPFWSEEE